MRPGNGPGPLRIVTNFSRDRELKCLPGVPTRPRHAPGAFLAFFLTDRVTTQLELSPAGREPRFTAEGLSTRGIAEAVNASQTQVRRDLESPTEPNGSVETITGINGKTYPASRLAG
jgi:hypothetical protein